MILFVKNIDIEGPETMGGYFQKKGFTVKTVGLDTGGVLPQSLDDLEAVVQARGRRMATLAAALALTTTIATVAGTTDLPPGDPSQGEALYRQYCTVCHGATRGRRAECALPGG